MATAAQETQRILLDHEFPSTPATVSILRLRLSEEVIGTLTIEVWDAVPEPPCLRSPELDAEDGRGLLIVAALATHYGWRPTRRGKWVFAVLAISPRSRRSAPWSRG